MAQPVIGLVPTVIFAVPAAAGGVHEVQFCAAIGFTIAITKIILISPNKFS